MRILRTLVPAVGVMALFLPEVVRAQELLTSPGLELIPPDLGGRDSAPPGWVVSEGPPVNAGFPPPDDELLLSMAEPSNFTHLIFEGDWQMWFQPYNATFAEVDEGGFAHLTQDVPGTPGMSYTMTGWALFEDYFPGGVDNLNLADPDGTPTGAPFDDGPESPTDTFFALEFLDAGDAVLPGSVEIELKAAGQPSTTEWTQHTLSAVAPAGTTNVRVRASMTGGVENPLPPPEGFQMSFFVDAFSLIAEAAPAVSGDYNENGTVDAADYTVWRDHLDTNFSLPNEDATPGMVTIEDYDVWKTNYGMTGAEASVAALAALAAVPEPAGSALVAIVLLGGATMRRRWRST